MRLTPDILVLAYSLLRETEPFKRWKLPPAAKVRFRVLRTAKVFGDYRPEPHQIRLSFRKHARLPAVLATMAHEMIHLHLEVAGSKEKAEHGKQFQWCARTVLRHHPEFDPGTF